MSAITQTTDTAVTVEQARERYQNGKAFQSDSTRDTYVTGVNHFVRWCEQNNYTNTLDLTKFNIEPFRGHLMDMDVKKYSKSTYINGVRDFLKYLDEQLGKLPEKEVYKALEIVSVPPKEKRRDATIEQDRLDGIIDYMKDYYPRHRDTIIM